MTKAKKPEPVTTGRVRLSYEHLLEPYANQGSPDAKYSGTFLIPKSDTGTKAAIDAAIREAIIAGVSGKWSGVQPPQVPVPIHDGDGVRQSGEPFGPECKGCWVITASSKQKQDVVDENMQDILDRTQVYSGMYCRVALSFFAYNSAGKKGIGCGLGPVQKLADGEPLGGRISAEQAFGNVPAYIPAQPDVAPQGYPQYAPQAPTVAPAQPQYAPQQGYAQPRQAVDQITGLPIR